MFEFGELIQYEDRKKIPNEDGRLEFKSIKVPAMKSLLLSEEERKISFINGLAQDYNKYSIIYWAKGWDTSGYVIIDATLIPKEML